MKIQELNDGSNRIELENGQTFYVREGVDPIDGMIDIGLMQQQTAYFLNKPVSVDDYVIPETFFYALSRRCFKEVGKMHKDEDWHTDVAKEFNLEISRQELLRIGEEIDTDFQFDDKAVSMKQVYAGKYKICYLDVLPELLSRTPESHTVEFQTDYEPTEHETRQYVVALSLLRLLHSRFDIRKIEARISELKGMCEYLKLIAPDEYNAYCLVVDRLGLKAELDINEYYELLEQIMQK